MAAAFLAAGRTARTETLTWSEARARAEQRAPELAAAARRLDAAAADVRVAGALANPVFTLTTASQTARLSAGVALPVPLFGQRGTAVRAASADADVVARDGDLVRHDVRWTATVAWVDSWEVRERARLLDRAADDAHRLLGVSEERFQAGSAPRLDVVRATAAEAAAQAEAGGARKLVDAANARLAVWVGGDPGAPASVAGGPGVPAALPPLPALAAGVGGHPEVARDRAAQAAADRHVELEQRLRFPVVVAEFVANIHDPSLQDVHGNSLNDYIGGASFELPVLSARGGAIAHARAQRALADATLAVDAGHLRAEVVDAYRRTDAAGTRAQALETRALPAMEEARAMTEESYRAGRADLVRVLEAERAVVDTRLAEVEAIAAWARAFADLERAAGSALAETEALHARADDQ